MQVGAAVNADGRVEAGMGVVAADFDSDGDEDLFMTHNVQETNTLYFNDGLGGFVDGTNSHGLGHSRLPYAGFGLAWTDFDDDGSRDLFIATGAVTIIEAQRGSPFPFVQANQFYRGTETGFVAAVGSEVWGGTEDAASRGLANDDLDNDGDLDVVIGSCNGPVRLYRNVEGTGRSIRIRLRGRSSNTSALGSSVSLCFTDGSREWWRVHRNGSYLSSSEAVSTSASATHHLRAMSRSSGPMAKGSVIAFHKSAPRPCSSKELAFRWTIQADLDTAIHAMLTMLADGRATEGSGRREEGVAGGAVFPS